jgi:hypothetical protein
VFIVDSDRNVCEDLVGGRVIAVGRFVEPNDFSGDIAAIRYITQNGSGRMAVGKEALLDLGNVVQQRVGSDNLSTHGGQVAELDGVELPGSALSCSAL